MNNTENNKVITQNYFKDCKNNGNFVVKLYDLIKGKDLNQIINFIKDNFEALKPIKFKEKGLNRSLKSLLKKFFIDDKKDKLYLDDQYQHITKQDYINMFMFLKILSFLKKHKQCKFEKKDGFWSVCDKNNNDNTKDFYFYSFGKNIEYFVDDILSQKICVKKRTEDKRQDHVATGLMSVSSFCVNKDNNILTTHYRGNEPQCFNIGCNFIIDENKPLSHDNYAFKSDGCQRVADEQFRFKTEKKHAIWGNRNSVTENLSLGRRCGISDIETILSIRFRKQNNNEKHSYLYNAPESIPHDTLMKNYDETILDTPEGKDEYKIHDFCFSFEPALFKTLQGEQQKAMLNKMKDQISKVVDANNKLGVKQINIIDYENKPSFIKIPNDIKCVQEYLDTRIQDKNFDNTRIEELMNNGPEVILLRDKLQYTNDEVKEEKEHKTTFVPQKKQKSFLTPWEDLSTGGKVWRSIWTLGFGTPLFNCCSCNNSVMTKD